MTQTERWIDELRAYEAEMRHRASTLNDHPPYTVVLRAIWTATANSLSDLRATVEQAEGGPRGE